MTREDCEKFAQENDLDLGDNKRVDALILGINKNIENEGKGYCPCRIQRIDDNVCPCKPCLEECATKGKCLCGMYSKKKELSKEEEYLLNNVGEALKKLD